MTGPKWDRRRLELLHASMTRADIDLLRARSDAAPDSLTLDEVGVLFLETRDRIRAIEAAARRSRNDVGDVD